MKFTWQLSEIITAIGAKYVPTLSAVVFPLAQPKLYITQLTS
jgi:hypothetical protein